MPKLKQNNISVIRIWHGKLLLKFFWSTKCLILESIVFALLTLVDVPSMCGFQVKCLSIFTPRYFTEFVVYNFFPLSLSFKLKSSCFFADLNRTISVLLTLRHILFALSQLLKVYKSLLTCLLMTLIEPLKFIRFVSSAK